MDSSFAPTAPTQPAIEAGSAGITLATISLTLLDTSTNPNKASDCQAAVNLLNKSTIDKGVKMASDAAFNLAAQLLGAELNIVAGAGACPAAVTAINQGQALLGAIHFDGKTHLKMSTAQLTQANGFAATLDKYNNDLLC